MSAGIYAEPHCAVQSSAGHAASHSLALPSTLPHAAVSHRHDGAFEQLESSSQELTDTASSSSGPSVFEHFSKLTAWMCEYPACRDIRFTADELDQHKQEVHGFQNWDSQHSGSASRTRMDGAKDDSMTVEPPSQTISCKTMKHLPQRPAKFQCSTCKKRYTRNGALSDHIRVAHSHQQDFHCSVCKRAFGRRRDRDRHQKLHGVEKQFCCTWRSSGQGLRGCGKSFARADGLMAHWRSQLGMKCYVEAGKQDFEMILATCLPGTSDAHICSTDIGGCGEVFPHSISFLVHLTEVGVESCLRAVMLEHAKRRAQGLRHERALESIPRAVALERQADQDLSTERSLRWNQPSMDVQCSPQHGVESDIFRVRMETNTSSSQIQARPDPVYKDTAPPNVWPSMLVSTASPSHQVRNATAASATSASNTGSAAKIYSQARQGIHRDWMWH